MSGKKAKIEVKEIDCQKLIERVVDNDDLLTDILLRVSAKSLVKFKCVSKHWLSIISDREFRYHHSAQSQNVPSAIIYYENFDYILKTLSLSGHQKHPPFRLTDHLVHTCNGLMLWWQRQRSPFYGGFYYVCNLTTNESTSLVQDHPSSSSAMFARISFDPVKSPHYKVVFARYTCSIDIYFSENKSWKCIKINQNLNGPQHVASCDGSVHCISKFPEFPRTHWKFDIDKERLIPCTFPPKVRLLEPEKIHYFGECGENLILIQYKPELTTGFRILKMEKGATCWTVKQRANLRPIMKLYPENKGFDVFSVLKGSGENDIVLVLLGANSFFTYDLRCKKLEVICDLLPCELGKYKHPWKRTFHFIESLAPI